MTTKHNHTHCTHKLEFCKHCDVVYCEKCAKEWKYNNWTLPSVTYCTSGINTLTADGGFSVGGDTLEIKHNH